jgi:hypothetical protein
MIIRSFLTPERALLALLVWLGLCAGPLPGDADTPEERGLALMTEADRRDTGWGDLAADLTMVLSNQEGQESKRLLRLRRLEGQGDGNKTLLMFDYPTDVKGTVLLTQAHRGQEDDQWLYLPALKRVKRIVAAQKAGSFMGSEFAYEDISGQDLARYTYRYVRDEVYEGLDCFVVERFPVDKHSGYTRQVAWLDKAAYRLWKVEYYDRKPTLLKTLTMSQYAQYLGQYWRPEALRMQNHQSGKSTLLTLTNYRFRTGLRDSDFHPSALEQAR